MVKPNEGLQYAASPMEPYATRIQINQRFPLSLGDLDGLRYFIVAIPEPSI